MVRRNRRHGMVLFQADEWRARLAEKRADLPANHEVFSECVKPNGSRGEFRSIGRAPLLIMAATTKSGAFSHQDVQQSDYIAAWNADEESNYRPTGFREKIKN